MKDKHTPGPWKVDGTYIYEVEQDKIIAEVETYNDNELPYEANARLMAAAPELLEFVEDVAEGLDTGGNPGYLEDAVENLEERAQRIIARIKGDE